MAPVAGRPFLFYVINYLRSQGISNFIFSLGYKHDIIQEYLEKEFSRLTYTCVIEDEPLGTGGAIQLACHKATSDNVVVTNGDTLFRANISELIGFHQKKNAECTLALKPMKAFDRYGAVVMDESGVINDFKEKQYCESGLINGGVYILDKNRFLSHRFPAKFSFEQEFLEKQSRSGSIYGLVQDDYFIDIGIPADFEQAQRDLQATPLDLGLIDNTWTLLLDRDGVINMDKEGSYIFTPDEFVFMEGAPSFFKKLTERFRYIIVVTNQRGVGRGLMTEDALTIVHNKMREGIHGAGGKLAAIYYATQNDNLDPDRKPNPGMALKAKYNFPDIDLSKTIMIGNNLSDMQFGRNAGLYTVFLSTTNKTVTLPHPDIDMMFDTLADFANAL
jgi:D-glycero-alpha-D-manno-heptose 1-phosphate guanylyltransferase